VAGLSAERALWHAINSAIADFLHHVLPLGHPHSERALTELRTTLESLTAPDAILEAALIQCLSILEPHAQRLPSLVDRFMAGRRRSMKCLDIFSVCVQDVLKYRGVGNPIVQRVIALMERNYFDSTLTEAKVASAVGLRPAALSNMFKAQTGSTFGRHLRDLRLDQGAILLVTTHKSVKEVWSAVGYNHASNFDHDFKARFGTPPREYRARGIQPDGDQTGAAEPATVFQQPTIESQPTVLIVDDDEGWRTTVGRYLRIEGFKVVEASSAAAAERHAKSNTFDAVLIDYHLGETSGTELLKVLRNAHLPGSPGMAILSADPFLDVLESEVRTLGACVASKVCELERIKEVVLALSGDDFTSTPHR
jgi:AraC-like DNA-binding protein/CheY-like chemotaxis protein